MSLLFFKRSFRRSEPFLHFLTLLVVSTPVRADFFLHGWEDHHQSAQTFGFAATESYFATSTNFDPFGNLVSPLTLQNLSRLMTDVELEYGFNDRLDVYVRLNWTREQLLTTSFVGTSYGLSDQSFGLSYRLIQSNETDAKPSLDLQVQGDVPFYSNASSDLSQSPYLGDASTDVTAGANLNFPLSQSARARILLRGGAGVTVRTNGFSAAVPWKVLLEYAPVREGLIFAFGGQGETSLKTDGPGPRTPVSATSGSQSFLINATNPSMISLEGGVGYQWRKNLSLVASAQLPVWGQAAPYGPLISLSLRTSVNPSAPASGNPVRQTPNEYGKANKGFVNYSTEAKVLKANDRLNLIKIDKGSQDGVEVGQIFDVFASASGEAVARAQITDVKVNEAVMKISEYYKEVWIDEGFVARRALQ